MSTGLQNVRWSFDHIEKLFKSAERWRELGEDAGLHNFELHAFRAVFQMVTYILRYFLNNVKKHGMLEKLLHKIYWLKSY